MYNHLYSKFIKENPNLKHFAAHSHHYWPDCTYDAQKKYWEDSAKHVDKKWDYFFGDKIPQTQKHIAEALDLNHPEQIVFAPNTHEFVFRLLSCLDLSKKQRVLTTDSEFHSFNRQIDRLNEMENIEVVKVSLFPFETFQKRFIAEASTSSFDFIFFSHVFFNTALVIENLEEFVLKLPKEPILTIDGYHGFMAIPTSLKKIEDRIFYLSGAYKYAQGGEGACFLYVPKDSQLRPLYTGWFASFETLEGKEEENSLVSYSNNGMRFAGSTIDMTAIYRLLSVFEMYQKENLDIKKIHEFVKQKQIEFLQQIDSLNHSELNRKNLVMSDQDNHGHFLSFKVSNHEICKNIHSKLLKSSIFTDFRGRYLRFGFGLYSFPFDLQLVDF